MKLLNTLLALLLCATFTIHAQNEEENVLFRAMNDEMKRSIDSLSLPNMQKPFFIAYTIDKTQKYFVNASFGAITLSTLGKSSCFYKARVDLLVGDYHSSNINYRVSGYNDNTNSDYVIGPQYKSELPDDCDYDEIRRTLWEVTDNVYKDAAAEYERKMNRKKQIMVSPELEALDDLSRISPIKKRVNHLYNQTFERNEYWKETLKSVSSVFSRYPDIYNCKANIEILSYDRYYVSSEGTQIVYPQNSASVLIEATIRMEDGEEIATSINYNELNDADVPSKDSLLRAAEKVAARILALKDARKVNERYNGPVLLEGNGVADRLKSFLTYKSGMTGFREPLVYQSNDAGRCMEENMNQKILPGTMTVTSEPGLKEFKGKALWGTYEVDAEGVVPPDKMIMVDKGILRNVVNGRIPTLKTPFSNGHSIPAQIDFGFHLSPGVVRFESTEGETASQLKEKLIRLAKEEGLEYAYILRSGSFSNLEFFRVSVADGSEQIVRGLTVSKIDVQKMKKIAGISSEQRAYNTKCDQVMLSIICPHSILLEDIEVTSNGVRADKKNLLVTSPMADKQKRSKSNK